MVSHFIQLGAITSLSWLTRYRLNRMMCTNTKSLAKEFSKILIFGYFGYLKMGFDVFLTLICDSESPRMTLGINATLRSFSYGVWAKNCFSIFRWSRDQCSAKRDKWLHSSVGLGFGLGYDSGYWLVLGLGSEIRAQGLQR